MRAATWWRSSTGLGLVLLLAASWEGSVRSGLVQADAWPALSTVGAVFLDRANFVDLWRELAVSVRHMLQGFALGSALGLVLGVLLGASRPLFRLLEPTLEILRVIPLPALIPPALLLLGGGAEMKISLCAIATFFPVLLNTLHGVRGVDQALIETASTFGVPRTRLVTRVTLPAALPMVLAGLRIALASALITTVVTEMIAGGGGIGLYIVTMQNAARMPEVYAALILMSLVGYALNRSLLALEHRAMPWYTRSE